MCAAQWVDLVGAYLGPWDDPKDVARHVRPIDGLAFDGNACARCERNCCIVHDKGRAIAIAEDELERIYARFPAAPRPSKLKKGRDGRRYYVQGKGACIFLGDDRRCTVYDARPRYCRDWPKLPVFPWGREEFAQTLADCPGASSVRPVLCLNSGGLASLVLLARVKAKGRTPYSLFVDYGQPDAERREAAARAMSDHYGGLFFSQTLRLQLADSPDLPQRDVMLFAVALAYSEARGIDRIAAGWHAGTAPTSGAVVKTLRKAARRAARERWGDDERLRLSAPLLECTRKQIRRMGRTFEVPFDLAYDVTPRGRSEKPGAAS